MKPTDQSDADTVVSKALRQWQITEPLPPRFQEQVWVRIKRQEAAAPVGVWTLFIQAVGNYLSRPSLAVSYVTLLLAIGIVAGYWHGRVDSARESQQLGARYVQMLDPYLTPHQ